MPDLTPNKRKQIDKIKLCYRRTIDVGIVLSMSLLILVFYSFQKFGEVTDIKIYVPDGPQILVAPPPTKPPNKPKPVRPTIPTTADIDSDEQPTDETLPEIKFTDIPGIDENDSGFDTGEIPEIPYYKVEIKPELIRVFPTKYPELARRSRLEGQVVIEVLIGTNGLVENTRILKSIEGLNTAAIEAVKRYIFSPAVQADKKVKVWMAIPIQFKLN